MIELHLHLDGSLSKEDIDYLSKKNNLPYDENTPLTVNGNEIGGIPFKKNEPAEILVSLDYHDYLSLEVECFE